MNWKRRVREECVARLRNLDPGSVATQTRLSSVLRRLRDEGLIDGHEFLVDGDRVNVHVYRSPVSLSENHVRFEARWVSVLDEMREAIDDGQM